MAKAATRPEASASCTVGLARGWKSRRLRALATAVGTRRVRCTVTTPSSTAWLPTPAGTLSRSRLFSPCSAASGRIARLAARRVRATRGERRALCESTSRAAIPGSGGTRKRGERRSGTTRQASTWRNPAGTGS